MGTRAPLASTSARGYGSQYQRERARWKIRVDAGQVNCWRCGKWIDPRTAWHLGHDDYDRRIIRGPEHASTCNLRAAAQKTNAIRRAKSAARKHAAQTDRPVRSRQW